MGSRQNFRSYSQWDAPHIEYDDRYSMENGPHRSLPQNPHHQTPPHIRQKAPQKEERRASEMWGEDGKTRALLS